MLSLIYYICIYLYLYIYLSIYLSIYLYPYLYIHTPHTYIYTYILYIYTYIYNMYIYIYIYIYIYMLVTKILLNHTFFKKIKIMKFDSHRFFFRHTFSLLVYVALFQWRLLIFILKNLWRWLLETNKQHYHQTAFLRKYGLILSIKYTDQNNRPENTMSMFLCIK